MNNPYIHLVGVVVVGPIICMYTVRRDLRDFLKLEFIYQHLVCECDIRFKLDLELARVPTSVLSVTDVGI